MILRVLLIFLQLGRHRQLRGGLFDVLNFGIGASIVLNWGVNFMVEIVQFLIPVLLFRLVCNVRYDASDLVEELSNARPSLSLFSFGAFLGRPCFG